MDLKTYEFYEVSKPQELADKLTAGMEVEVWEVMGYKFISRIK